MMAVKKGEVLASAGLRKLISADPCQQLLHAVEQVQHLGGHRRLARVLKHTRKRTDTIGWIHASESSNPCDRIMAARLLGYSLKREEQRDLKLERIFENGHMMHLRWQNYMVSLPKSFKVLIAPVFRVWPIEGEADAIIEHQEFGRVVVELKSIHDYGFKQLRTAQRPHDDHIGQVATYVALDGFQATPQVWYEDKNTQEACTFCPECAPAMKLSVARHKFEELRQRIIEIAMLVVQGQLPAGCGECGHDEEIGDIKLDESRITELRQVMEKPGA